MALMTFDEALALEAIRLNERYTREVVEEFGLCPWAEKSRRDGRVKTLVLLQDSPTLFEPSLKQMHELASDERIEIGLLVYPRLALGRLDFEHFARQLRQLDAERYELSGIPFAMAAFHPEARADTSDAERLIPFLRRTPDPTLQLLRSSVMDAIRSQFNEGTQFFEPGQMALHELPLKRQITVREQIARKNLTTVSEVGMEVVEAVLSDIRRDRDRTYQALAERAAAGML